MSGESGEPADQAAGETDAGADERGEGAWLDRLIAAGRWVLDTFRGHAGVREMRRGP